jgi:hypothetical protein
MIKNELKLNKLGPAPVFAKGKASNNRGRIGPSEKVHFSTCKHNKKELKLILIQKMDRW